MTEKKVPERRRIVADGNGLHIDPSGKMPGRGAYLCRNEECAKMALKKNAFGRNLKTEVSRQQAESIVEQIAQLSR